MAINLGSSSDCRAKDKTKCPFHSHIVTMEKAAASGDVDGYLDARREALAEYKSRERAVAARRLAREEADIVITPDRQKVLDSRAAEFDRESVSAGLGVETDIALRHNDQDDAKEAAFIKSHYQSETERMQEKLDLNGGKTEFEALFDTEGKLVPAKKINTQYGVAWALIEDENDATSSFTGFFSPSKAQNAAQREVNNRKKGYYVGKVLAPARVVQDDTANVRYFGVRVPKFIRTDNGFDKDAQVLDNGRAPIND